MFDFRGWIAVSPCRWWGHDWRSIGQADIPRDAPHKRYKCSRCGEIRTTYDFVDPNIGVVPHETERRP